MFKLWAILSSAVAYVCLKWFPPLALPWSPPWLQHFLWGPEGCQRLVASAVAGRRQSPGAKAFPSSALPPALGTWREAATVWHLLIPTAPMAKPSLWGGGEARRSWTNCSECMSKLAAWITPRDNREVTGSCCYSWMPLGPAAASPARGEQGLVHRASIWVRGRRKSPQSNVSSEPGIAAPDALAAHQLQRIWGCL